MFQFKQFSVDQSNCAMKINTDGVLLGALSEATDPASILDIGAGTGVIALMLAQRYTNAKIDAVEVDPSAAATAAMNFKRSPFNKRLTSHAMSFERYSNTSAGVKYDMIVTNPPFYINSLHSPGEKKQLAKHADKNFFEDMLSGVARFLSENGSFWAILPLQTAGMVKDIAYNIKLNIKETIYVRSFKDREPHREIIALSLKRHQQLERQFVIYEAEGVYSVEYRNALQEFFTIF